MWFMHDGTPPHFLHIVRQHLNQTFGEQWIGRGGPVKWPARSPDLDPLWGHLKTLVYSAAINDFEVLQQRVENACQESRVKPGIFDRLRTSVRRRAGSCLKMHGNHICCRDHTNIAHISAGICFWTYVDWDFLLV
jgi:hypothetical protein